MSDQNQNEQPQNIKLAKPLEDQEKDSAQEDYQSGVDYLSKGDFSMAANAFHNALIGYEQADNQEGVANAYDKLGDLCFQRGDFDKALYYIDKIYVICEEKKDFFSILSLRKKKAACFSSLKKYSEAIALYLDLLDVYEGMQNPESAVKMILNIADIYQEKGELKNCVDAYKTAASIHANYKHPNKAAELMAKAEELEKGGVVVN